MKGALQAMTEAKENQKKEIVRLRKELAHMQANLRQGVPDREEIRQKAEEALKDVLYLTEGLALYAANELKGLHVRKTAAVDSLLDFVGQARDIALTLQDIWEAVSERQNPTA